jgi:hypothetical protein
MLSLESIGQAGQIAYIVFESRGSKPDRFLEYGGGHLPVLNELVNILWRKKIFMRLPIPLDFKNGFVDLRFDRNLDIDVSTNGCEAGEPVSLIIFPLG